MPRRDETGPMGFGAMAGRSVGFCNGANTFRHGRGRRFSDDKNSSN